MRTTIGAFALACLVTGCSGKSAVVKAPDKSNDTTVKPASGAEFPIAPPFARPGEHMGFSLALHGVVLATFNIDVAAVTQLEGKEALPVSARAQTLGIAKLIEKVDDQFSSWVDTTSGRPLLFRSHEAEGGGGSDGVEDADTQFTKKTEKSVPVVLSGAKVGQSTEEQVVGKNELWDMNSFFLILRNWQPADGASITADVVRSRFVWRATITYAKKEAQVTKLGTFPTLRFEGKSRRLERDGKEVTGDDRLFTIWITDDNDRVPVLIEAKTDYGPVRMEITDYAQGVGNRLFDGAAAGD